MSEHDAFNRLKDCRHGKMLYNINDMYIGRSLDLYGEFSEGEIDIFKQMVRPGQVVVEVGANIGTHTLFLSQQVGPTGIVLAFEPQRIVFQTLCANLALNSVMNVDCRQAALGAEPGEIRVPSIDYRRPGNFGGLSLGEWQQGEIVPLITLDSLQLGRCHLIKIDVEGMEKQVLQGALSTITRFKPLLYVENDRKEKSLELVQYLTNLGYDMYWHAPPLFNANNFAQNPENVFGEIVSLNMLCIHRSIPQKLEGFQKVELPQQST